MDKPIVGDVLLLVDCSPGKGLESKECCVSKVGRVYFHVDHIETWPYCELIFRLSDWEEKESYISGRFLLFKSKDEYVDFLESVRLIWMIRKEFQYGSTHSQDRSRFSLSQLKEVVSILNLQEYEKDDRNS